MAVDVDEIRRNVGRLAAVQGVLLAGVVAFAIFGGDMSPLLVAAVALLPVLLATWGFWYDRAMRRARDAGARDDDYRDVNAKAVRLVGLLAVAWAVALVVALVLG